MDGRNAERARAFKARVAAEQRQSSNPNRGKRRGARMGNNGSKIRASAITTRHLPGKTIAARIAGIEAWYARDRALQEVRSS